MFCGWPHKPFGTERIMSESLKSDTELHTVGFGFCFDLTVTVSSVLPSGSKKACNLFFIFKIAHN